MRTKRSKVVWCAGALVALLVSAPALAKDAKKKEKDEGPEHKAGMMEEGSKDPAQTETLDEDGAFVPGKKKKQQPGATAGAEAEGGAAAGSEGEAGTEGEKKPAPEPEKKPVKARKTIGLFAEALIGFGEAPEPLPNNATTGSSTSYAFLLGGHFDVTPALRLMLRVPWTTGSIQSNNGKKTTNALGAPEIAARYRISDPGDTEWAVRLGIGIPIAQGNSDPTATADTGPWEQGRLQRVADAANGWHDPELYAPKRLPISPALLLTHRMDKLRLNGELKAVMMPALGGSIHTPNTGGMGSDGKTVLNGFAFTALLGGTASYEVLSHGYLALAAWATYTPSPTIEYTSSATSPSPFQFVLEPKLLAQFGRVVPSVGFIAPIGGQLGGLINGVRAHVDVIF
jgi:hypothetical protein